MEQCLVRLGNSTLFTYSNLGGEFSLDYDSDSSHSVIVSREEYETQEIPIEVDPLWVILKRRVNVLHDVVVSADYGTGTAKQGLLGKKNLKQFGIATGRPRTETAIFLRANPTRHGLLQEVYFYVTKEGVPNSRFKVHVYDIGISSLPGSDLLDTNICLHANTGDEWVSVNLTSRHIPIGKGVFISMEWMSGSGNNPDVIDAKKYKGELKNYDAQVLGFTRGYHRQHSINYHRSKTNNKWQNSEIGSERGTKYLNPMIYATYTYFQK